MHKTNLIIIGGFLGAGKTTSILAMTKQLLGQGRKIGIVTNDQGSQLVDTHFLATEGLSVLEVTGGCFCCNFDEFTQRVNELTESDVPDFILAEPVGSCTDLIATIFKPLQQNLTRQFTLRPLSIVADPKRIKRLMMDREDGLFPNEINYLFRKQLEEADIILLNKTDLLSAKEIASITAFLRNEFKGVDVLPISAKNGTGVEDWISMITERKDTLRASLDIDYRIYGTAEEYLGWLNSSLIIDTNAQMPADINDFIHSFMEDLKEQLRRQNKEIAHLKVYCVTEDDWLKASLTSVRDQVDFNRKMEKSPDRMNLIINARVNTDPETLKLLVEDTLFRHCMGKGFSTSYLKTECFKPGKPNPRYRIAN